MSGPFTHGGTYVQGEDVDQAGTLRKLQQLHEILKAVDDMGGQEEDPSATPSGVTEYGPETGPWNPRHPKFSAFMQKWGPLVQMGGAALSDINADRIQPRIDTGRVVNRQPSSVDQLRGQWAHEGAVRQHQAEKQQERRDTFHRESMLNRRAMLPTILSALLKEDEKEKPEKKATAQALLEFTEQQDWFQKLDPAEQNRVRKGILKVKEEDEDLSPYERGYESTRGRLDAEIETGGRWKPDKETEQLGDAFEREMYGKLLTKQQGPLEDPMTPEKAAILAKQAREQYFGPKAPPPGAGMPGMGGAPLPDGGAPQSTIGPKGDPNFPDLGVADRIQGAGLSGYEIRVPNYSPAPAQNMPPQAQPLAPPPVQAQAGGGGPVGGQVPLTGQALSAIAPALRAYDVLKQKYATLPEPMRSQKLAIARQAFMAEFGGVDPELP